MRGESGRSVKCARVPSLRRVNIWKLCDDDDDDNDDDTFVKLSYSSTDYIWIVEWIVDE